MTEDFYLRHITYMDMKHADQYKRTGELQLPLFDVNDVERTWKTTDSWSDEIKELDAKRAEHLGQS